MLVNKVSSKDKVHTGLDMLSISSHKFVRLLFESGYYLRAAFIKLGTEDEEIHCLKESGVAADARESTPRDTATLATVMDTELKESGPLHRC